MPTYLAFRHRQTDESPSILTFVAPAEDIRTWAGIPHKTTDFVGGFQRPLSDRFKQLITFFDHAGNVSPTAIVVAFRPGMCKVTPRDLPTEWSVAAKKDFLPELVEIEISTPDFSQETLERLAARVFETVSHRLKAPQPNDEAVQEAPGAPPAVPDGSSQPEQAAPEEDLPSEDTPELGEWGVDVGKSALSAFVTRLRDNETVEQFVQDIAKVISDDDAQREQADVPGALLADTKLRMARQRLRDVLESLLKPAMIVDGQHRVWGAAESTQEVPFAVCALADASWREQVFQFIVINKQARAISGELLASIVNSSLTNAEILKLEKNLDAAGISTYETRILRIVNDDPDSPFQGLISQGLEDTAKKITFKAAIALASRWQRRMNDRDPVYKALFRPGMLGSSNAEKLENWGTRWKDYLFAFWNGIKNLYKDEQLWEAGTQLMYRATLQVLQENFLDAKAIAGVSFSNPIELREAVGDFYRGVPAGFFHTKWKRTELLTDDGLEVLKNALNEMRVPGAKLGTLTKNNPLFTGAATKAGKKK